VFEFGSLRDVVVRWYGGRLFNDRLRRSADERTPVLRTWNLAGNYEESGGKSKAVHDGNRHSKLIDISIIVRQGDRPVLAVSPLCDFRLSHLARRRTYGTEHQPGDSDTA
jgi:hypothetical protein